MNKYSFKEAFNIWSSCHTVKGRRITRLQLIMFMFISWIGIIILTFVWWIPVRRIMKNGVKDKSNYSYFTKMEKQE